MENTAVMLQNKILVVILKQSAKRGPIVSGEQNVLFKLKFKLDKI